MLRRNLGLLSSGGRHYSSISAATTSPSTSFNKTEENGVVHVTSLNVHTNDRSVVELRVRPTTRRKKIRREYVLPENAASGLRNVLLECSRTPKQIQNESDQLVEKLNMRRFPAPPEAVKAARDQIKRQFRSEQKNSGELFEEDEVLNNKIKEAREYQLRNKVDKILKNAHFDWKPLEFSSKEAAATYALSRIVPNYAEISRVLEELGATDFAPASVLDYGSGCGSGFWAAHEMFDDTVSDYCLVDTSDQMTKMAMDIMRGDDGALISKKLSFRRHLVPSEKITYDLVIAHRTLAEMGSMETRMQQMESLWSRTNRFLVLIESGHEDSFNALIDVRDHILSKGVELRKEATLQLLGDSGLLDEHIENTIYDQRISEFERFAILREKVSDDVILPTVLPTATLFAPCPHDLGCPIRGRGTCSFPIRWRSLRADGRQSPREKDGTGTGRFSYVILEKGTRRPHDNLSRILKIRKMNGHVTCDLCTSFKGIQRLTVSKRAGDLYQRVRTRREGEIFPLEINTKATESMFDIFEQVTK